VEKLLLTKRFVLNPEVFLVKGAKRGALYDLSTGNVYSIDENSVKILEMCENGIGVSLSRLLQNISEIKPEEIMIYFQSLYSLNLGRFVDENEIVSKIDLPPLRPKLDFIWLELTQECNLRCLHCYANSGPKRKQNNKENLSLAEWKKVIQDAFDAGCRRLQFIGGEPMLFGKDIYVLIELARKLGYELIEIFTNATLFTPQDIDLLANYNVQIAISIYSKRQEIHDKITTVKGSYNRTMENVKKLQEKGIPVRFSTVIMKQNEEYTKETLEFLKELGEVTPSRCFDVVRPVGRGKDRNVIPQKMRALLYKKRPYFYRVSRADFIRRKQGHDCWQGKIAVKSAGDVIPCIMAREFVCGNVKKQSFMEILWGNKLQDLWKISKDKVKICKDCEYRYACIDCRAMAKNLYVRDKNCLYNPYKGEWEVKEVRENVGDSESYLYRRRVREKDRENASES